MKSLRPELGLRSCAWFAVFYNTALEAVKFDDGIIEGARWSADKKGAHDVYRGSENPPAPLVGAGHASGALAFELVTFPKTSSPHTALPEALYFAIRAKGWGCRATGPIWLPGIVNLPPISRNFTPKHSCSFLMHVAFSQLITSPQSLQFLEPNYLT